MHRRSRSHEVKPVLVGVLREKGHQKAFKGDSPTLQYRYLGDGLGFQPEVEARPGWSASGWGWPPNSTQWEAVADKIKGLLGTWLYCDLDLRCGKEVVAMALRRARLQRRARGHFLVVCPAAWDIGQKLGET